ncbi:MAG TPA: type II toxin-antitoxin system prevent-host-death family antitoxin [Solirubrobacteraceae bacterium]
MADVSIRDLRNHGGEIVDRAARGEAITITRNGKAVARLATAPTSGLGARTLVERWRRLPAVDAASFRADLDETLDARV